MKKLNDLFTDIFELKKITNARLTTFANFHLVALVRNNPGGIFDALIAPTENTLKALRNSEQGKYGSIGDRKGTTLAKKKARVAFNRFIRRNEGAVRAKFAETSAPYKEFFPTGLTAYDRASDMKYQGLLHNIIARATQYEADLGSDFKNQATTLTNAYLDAGKNQVKSKSKIGGFRNEISLERAELTRQLTFNALFIAASFLLQPEKQQLYFRTSLLFAQHRKHRHKGKPAPDATTLVCKINYEAGKYMWMKNKGATPLLFQMYLLDSPVGSAFTLAPSEELHKRMDEFFSNADELRVTNLGTIDGWFMVTEVA